MRRETLNFYIGKPVRIEFEDGSAAAGVLEFITEFCAAQKYRKPGYYAIGNWSFKCSHVKKLRVLEGINEN